MAIHMETEQSGILISRSRGIKHAFYTKTTHVCPMSKLKKKINLCRPAQAYPRTTYIKKKSQIYQTVRGFHVNVQSSINQSRINTFLFRRGYEQISHHTSSHLKESKKKNSHHRKHMEKKLLGINGG